MEENIKLTKLAKCAGCGAKVGAGVLAQLLDDIKVHHDPKRHFTFLVVCIIIMGIVIVISLTMLIVL